MKSFKLFVEQASPMIKPPKNEFAKKDVAEGAKWRKHPDAYDVDDEGNKTPRNPNSPKFGYDPLQRRADTANDAKTSKGKVSALKTSLKMAKGQKGVAEGNSGAKYQIKSIGKDIKGEYYISPSTGKKVYKSGVNKGDHENPKTGEIKKVVVETSDYFRRTEQEKKAKERVVEGGPFSYGSKPPRKGSVAYNALMKRKEQEKNKPPIEPKDQMVGTAKLVKEEDHELKAAIKRRDENQKKMKFSDAEHIYAKEFDAIMKKRGYGKHNPIPLRLSDKDIKD